MALAVRRRGVFVYSAGSVHAFTHGGKRLFPPISGVSAPPLAVPNRLIVAKSNKTLEFLNQANGKVLRRARLGSLVTARPLAVKRHIAVGTGNGEILLIDPEKAPVTGGRK